MMGLILALLVGFVVVAVAAPLVLWRLSMETLAEQAGLTRGLRAKVDAPTSCRGGFMAQASCTGLADAAHDDDCWSAVSEVRTISIAA